MPSRRYPMRRRCSSHWFPASPIRLALQLRRRPRRPVRVWTSIPSPQRRPSPSDRWSFPKFRLSAEALRSLMGFGRPFVALSGAFPAQILRWGRKSASTARSNSQPGQVATVYCRRKNSTSTKAASSRLVRTRNPTSNEGQRTAARREPAATRRRGQEGRRARPGRHWALAARCLFDVRQGPPRVESRHGIAAGRRPLAAPMFPFADGLNRRRGGRASSRYPGTEARA